MQVMPVPLRKLDPRVELGAGHHRVGLTVADDRESSHLRAGERVVDEVLEVLPEEGQLALEDSLLLAQGEVQTGADLLVEMGIADVEGPGGYVSAVREQLSRAGETN